MSEVEMSASGLGPLWAITSYYNPMGYRRRRENYRVFRQHLHVPLVTVEWSPEGQFALEEGDAEVLVRVRDGDVLWQKERLLNVALQHLPVDCAYVAWLDCDIVLEREEWPDEAMRRLDEFPLLQLWDRTWHWTPAPLDRAGQADAWREGQVLFERIGAVQSLAQYATEWLADGMKTKSHIARPSTGMAWAGRREWLDRIGLIDTWVIGGADRAMFCAAIGAERGLSGYYGLPLGQQNHYFAWAERFRGALSGGVGYLPGVLNHLWHGDILDRNYHNRQEILVQHRFDPERHLCLTTDGAWAWSAAVPLGLPETLVGYFRARREDGSER